MRVKIFSIFASILLLPLFFGIFSEPASAFDLITIEKINCDSVTSCTTELFDLQDKYYKLSELKKAFSECIAKCRGVSSTSWLVTKVSLLGEKKDCFDVFSSAVAQAETTNGSISDYYVGTNKELDDQKKALLLQINDFQQQLFALRTVDSRGILQIEGQTSFSSFSGWLGKAIDLLVKMVGVVALVFVVVAGFRLVVAAGNDNEIQKAKSMLQYSIIGLVITLLAYLIVIFIQGILYS